MREIIINNDNQKSNIVVVEDGKVVEHYSEFFNNKTIEGNIYLGKVVSVLPGMQAAFIDIGEEKNAFLHIKDVLPKASDITGNKNEKLSNNDIKKYVRAGMPIIVQIKKDKIETKGARVSTNINIPGKYVALVPNSNFVTISNKIEDEAEINRLKNIVKEHIPGQYGYIFRTAAFGKEEKEIIKEIEKLDKLYKNIVSKAEELINEGNYPANVFEIGGITNKIIMGLADYTEKIEVNDHDVYKFILNKYPETSEKITLHDKNKNIFSDDILAQIKKLESRKIWLKCGGFITIDRTEALTAIDVNTGKYIGKDSLEQTILKVNEEASIEIAKQLRARDIGGIIIIDYIDMEEEESEKIIVQLLEKELKTDRAKTQVVGFTKLHLLEMTRKHLYTN